METPLQTRIAHAKGEHEGEEETHASLGCGACYRAVAEGEPLPAPEPRWLIWTRENQAAKALSNEVPL